MQPLEVIALCKAYSEAEQKEARSHITHGKHHVDFTARIYGALSVGEDYETPPTARAMSLETVATALYYAGATRNTAMEVIMRSVLGKEEIDEDRKMYVSWIKEKLKAAFASLPKVPCKGQVRGTVSVEYVADHRHEAVEVSDVEGELVS